MKQGAFKRTICGGLLGLGLGVYLFFLAVLLFRSSTGIRVWNLFPLRTILEFVTGFDYVTGHSRGMMENAALANLLGNVVIFVPLGVYTALFRKNGPLWQTVLIAAGASLAAELVQVASQTGIGDIDDVLLNALGGLAGALLYRALCRICGGTGRAETAVAVLAPIAGTLCLVALALFGHFF